MRRALIVSDDVHTVAWMRQATSGLDLDASGCRTGEVADALAASEFDLVVLDAGHTPEPPAHIVENAASEGAEIRLLLVVEPDALASLRLPTRLHADFVVRGASADEVAARVRNLMWPGEEVSADEIVRCGDLTLNLATYQASLGGEPIDFAYLEYALFAFLVTHPGRAYSREVLLRRVWGTDYYGGSRTVDVHVRRIRAKIGTELSEHLKTVRNVGYLWEK